MCHGFNSNSNRKLRQKVIRFLGMRKPKLIYVSPCKSNIIYSMSTFESYESTFGPLLSCIQREKMNLPRVIIYCHHYQKCSSLYIYFRNGLGHDFTEPTDAPDVSHFRLLDMYVSCTGETTKTTIIEQFTQPSQLRIVICTVAFEMGMDCPDVHQIYHFGPPDDVEFYIQETGRAGRNGDISYAILLKTKGWKRCVHDDYMIVYEQHCQRKVLFGHMEGYHSNEIVKKCLCCHVCQKQCICSDCIDKVIPITNYYVLTMIDTYIIINYQLIIICNNKFHFYHFHYHF